MTPRIARRCRTPPSWPASAVGIRRRSPSCGRARSSSTWVPAADRRPPVRSRVGPTGFAYGLDMTDEMLELARRNAAEAGATNVEFRKGRIESIPSPTLRSTSSSATASSTSRPTSGRPRARSPGAAAGRSDRHQRRRRGRRPRRRRTGRARQLRRLHRRGPVLRRIPGRARRRRPRARSRSRRPTAVGGGLHGEIVRATKPVGWTMADIRPSGPSGRRPGCRCWPRVNGCCGAGCGCSSSSRPRLTSIGEAGYGQHDGVGGEPAAAVAASNRSSPRSLTSIRDLVVPWTARSAATRATPGPHIIP